MEERKKRMKSFIEQQFFIDCISPAIQWIFFDQSLCGSKEANFPNVKVCLCSLEVKQVAYPSGNSQRIRLERERESERKIGKGVKK